MMCCQPLGHFLSINLDLFCFDCNCVFVVVNFCCFCICPGVMFLCMYFMYGGAPSTGFPFV